jgi:hypothetical protein
MTQVTHLEHHPNLNEILGLLAQLPHVTDAQLPQLAKRWRNTAYIADARAKALAPDSPLVLEVLACFEAVVALFADDLAGEADYVTVPVSDTTTALKAVRDAIAAAYARPILSRGQYTALLRPWREVFPEQRLDEPDLGPAATQIKTLLRAMPRLATRCHEPEGRQVYDDLVRAAITMDADLRQIARDEAWQAAVLTSRRRVWAMVRRSGVEAMSRTCRDCADPGDRMADDLVLELCLDAACGLLVVDALDDTLADVLVMPLRDLIPLPRTAPDDVA